MNAEVLQYAQRQFLNEVKQAYYLTAGNRYTGTYDKPHCRCRFDRKGSGLGG